MRLPAPGKRCGRDGLGLDLHQAITAYQARLCQRFRWIDTAEAFPVSARHRLPIFEPPDKDSGAHHAFESSENSKSLS